MYVPWYWNQLTNSQSINLSGFYRDIGVIQKGEKRWGGVLKKRTKTNRGRGVKPICTFALWKKLRDFQTEGRVLSEKLLGSCWMFFVLSQVQHIKGFFLLKRHRHFFFSLNVFLWTCKYLYCHCVYNSVKNIDLLCWVYKKIRVFVFPGPWPFPWPWPPTLAPNLYLSTLAANLYLPAMAPNLYLPALAPTPDLYLPVQVEILLLPQYY